MTDQPKPQTLDLVWTACAIAKVIGRSERQTKHALSKGALPGRKVAGRWVASRKALERFFAGEAA